MVNSAGVNFGKPNEEFIIESDGNGAITSARNAVTGDEYVGGGGDFSTAQVTITNEGDGLLVALVDDDHISSAYYDSGTITAVLYDGSTFAEVYDESNSIVINSGAATYLIPGNTRVIVITGDCTLNY